MRKNKLLILALTFFATFLCASCASGGAILKKVDPNNEYKSVGRLDMSAIDTRYIHSDSEVSGSLSAYGKKNQAGNSYDYLLTSDGRVLACVLFEDLVGYAEAYVEVYPKSIDDAVEEMRTRKRALEFEYVDVAFRYESKMAELTLYMPTGIPLSKNGNQLLIKGTAMPIQKAVGDEDAKLISEAYLLIDDMAVNDLLTDQQYTGGYYEILDKTRYAPEGEEERDLYKLGRSEQYDALYREHDAKSVELNNHFRMMNAVREYAGMEAAPNDWEEESKAEFDRVFESLKDDEPDEADDDSDADSAD